MFVIGYLLCLIVILQICKKKSDEFKNSLIFLFNYFVGIFIHIYLNYSTVINEYDAFRLLLISIQKAPTYMGLGFASSLDISNLQLFFISFLMYLCTIRLVLVLFFKKVILYIHLTIRKLRCKQIIIVKGNESDAFAFIENIHKKDKKIMMYYLTTSTKQPLIEALMLNEDNLEKILATNKTTVVLLPDEYNNNIVLLDKLNTLGKKYKIKVSSYISNELLRQEDLVYENIESYITSKESLLVQNFLLDYLPLKSLVEHRDYELKNHMVVPDQPYHCLMIGFSSLHKEFLLSIYENTAFKTGKKSSGLKSVIINNKGKQEENNFFEDYKSLKGNPSITFEYYNTNEIYDYIYQHASELDCILVDESNTDLNIEMAMRIIRIFKKLELKQHALLTIALYDPTNGSISLIAGEENILFQQVNSNQYTYENLIECKVDKEAQKINARYNETSKKNIEWNHLSTFTKASNRAVILDLMNKDLLVGDIKELDKNQLETLCWQLARYEHERWNHFHFAHGWTSLPVEELSEEEKARFATKRLSAKRHTCLIDFDALNDLPQEKPGLIQYYDYENVLHFIELRKEKKDESL